MATQLSPGSDVQVQFLEGWGPYNKGEIMEGMITEMCTDTSSASIFTLHGRKIIPLQDVAINIKKEQHHILAYSQIEKLKKSIFLKHLKHLV